MRFLIFQRRADEEFGAPIGEVTGETFSFLVENLDPGVTYFFAVSAEVLVAPAGGPLNGSVLVTAKLSMPRPEAITGSSVNGSARFDTRPIVTRLNRSRCPAHRLFPWQ